MLTKQEPIDECFYSYKHGKRVLYLIEKITRRKEEKLLAYFDHQNVIFFFFFLFTPSLRHSL